MLCVLANTQESDFSGFVHSMDVKQHFTVVLSCFSLIINEVEHLFTCTIFVSSSLKSLFIAFAHFFLWLVVLPQSLMSVLYVLRMLIAFLISCNVTQPAQSFSGGGCQAVGQDCNHLKALLGLESPFQDDSWIVGSPFLPCVPLHGGAHDVASCFLQ